MTTMRELISESMEKAASGSEAKAGRLRELYDAYGSEYVFEPGMLVTWKYGLKNKRYPEYGQPVIVVEQLANPVKDQEKSAGSPYFREPLDLVCGKIAKGKFVLLYYDSRRFMPYEEWLRHEQHQE